MRISRAVREETATRLDVAPARTRAVGHQREEEEEEEEEEDRLQSALIDPLSRGARFC